MMRLMPGSRLVVFALVATAVGISNADEVHVRTARLKSRSASTPALAASAVREAIAQETIGDTKQRDAMLDDVLAAAPDFAPARWQKGFVETRAGWQHIDELMHERALSSRDTIYRNLRRKSADDIASHVQLARWCERRSLAESARGHWYRVLSLDANNPEAHRALGDQYIDNKWVSSEQRQQNQTRSEATEAAQRDWGRKVSEWAEGFANGSPTRKSFCEKNLRDVADPAAAPILALNLAQRGDECALLFVDILRSMPQLEATHALSDLGVRTKSVPVRRAIVSELKVRDEHMVIPPLLLAMSSPATAEMRLIVTDEGALVYRHVFSTKESPRTAQNQDARFVSMTRTRDDKSSLDSELFVSPLESELSRRNLTIQQSNERIELFLSEITGAHNGKPEDWWKWWNRRQQVEVGEELVPAQPTAPAMPNRNMVSSVPNANITFARPQSRRECFVRGTPVWTPGGKVAIETIQTGDLVLSQDMKTGELAFKGVVQPTQRPPQKVYELEIGCAKLECTGGHAFWVPGSGWVKASGLKPGMLVRCVDGAEPVLSIQQNRTVETHNLVVADFHSYFVGEEKTLCHDNTDQRPTLAIAPGIYREGEAPRPVRQ